MTIFFINSPAEAIHSALPMIKEKKIDDLTIVTTKDMKHFFEQKTNGKVIVPEVHPNLITKKTKRKLISNAIKSKFEYKRLFKNIENEEIYLFFTSWSVVHMSYVKKLSKKNKIYLCHEDYITGIYDESKNISSFFMRLAAKILLNIDVKILIWEGTPVWELKKNSFPMEIISYDKFNNKLPKEFMEDIKDIKDKDMLFLAGFLGEQFNVDYDESKENIEFVNELVDIFDNLFGNKYVIKGHPRDGKLYGKMKESKNILPEHYLAETLFGHKWKYIIGFKTEALASAALHTNAKVISLINLYDWNDYITKKWYVNVFNKSNVLMPKTLDEFKEMLGVDK